MASADLNTCGGSTSRSGGSFSKSSVSNASKRDSSENGGFDDSGQANQANQERSSNNESCQPRAENGRPPHPRFRLADLVDLGNGWARLPEPGEEVYRFVLLALDRAMPWMSEARMLEEATLMGCWQAEDVVIESMIVPVRRKDTAELVATEKPDPRQLALPIEAA